MMRKRTDSRCGHQPPASAGSFLRGQSLIWRVLAVWLAMLAWIVTAPAAWAVDVHVVDTEGNPVSGFRWLLQEDTTYHVKPGEKDPHTLSTSFHASHSPVLGSGLCTTSTATVETPGDKHYYISVLPDKKPDSEDGYTLAGAMVEPGQAETTVTVSATPLPTAQLSVFIFNDNHPINNTPDLPQEEGLAGFKVNLYDAGGRYGVSGGQMMMDAYGNMLGSEYDAEGNLIKMGNGTLTTGPSGEVTFKNLAPGKYTVLVTPPAGQGWIQTSTIEGTKGIDAWVKANEPQFFVEFGPPGWHVFVGFTKKMNDTTVLTGGRKITGQVVNMHNSRPPDYSFHPGEPVSGAWVGLNDMAVAGGRGVFAAPCDATSSTFTIDNVPPGNYQLVIWDSALDVVFASKGITVTADQDLDLGQVPVFNWFARMQQVVFHDKNENGFRDPDEKGIPEVPVNLRFRDGSMYQSATTDVEGKANLMEVFPFFHWLVAEVDFARLKATGATVVVDNGGPVQPDRGWDYPSRGVLTPQPHFEEDGVTPAINPNTGNNLSRTEVGPTLTQGFQAFLGQTNVIEWGKTAYGPMDIDNEPKGETPGPEDMDHNHNGRFDSSNGGVSGVVYYAVTRAEDDPRYSVADPWEPGIPRIQVNLYKDANRDGVIDDLDQDGQVTLADVDNYPFGWTEPTSGSLPVVGPEDVDRNGNSEFDLGDALNSTTTDSWDDNVPTGAQGDRFVAHGVKTDCYDGLRCYNQVRPGVFDGGYAFTTAGPDTGAGLPEGTYIVEAAVPPGYEIVKEEDKNVDFGETYKPSTLALPPVCVGDPHTVPAELRLFPGVECKFAGQTRPLPDRKQVTLSKAQNTPCDFHMFTEVPIASRFVGIILDDLANEFDPSSPQFGEKYSPPWLPVSIRDWTGREISRTYSDQWGAYNAMVPSTYTANVPIPSGMSPNMLTVVLNSPGPILDKDPASPTFGQWITDPHFNRQYSQFSYTFQYMPGTTTYLDTPVLPISAFAGPDQFPLDSDLPDGTPVIWSASGPNGGPYVAQPGQRISIASAGQVTVPNPAFEPGGSAPKTIKRNYGFGADKGQVTLGGVPLTGVIWTDGAISVDVPAGAKTGELVITKANGQKSVVGVTLTVGPIAGNVHYVYPSAKPGATPIQDKIDAAQPGDLILVAPGNYDELVVMWKPVQLQGWGAVSTRINAVKTPSEKLLNWRKKMEELIKAGKVDLLPGQKNIALGGIEPGALNTEEGPGIFVIGRNAAASSGGFGQHPNARIDGLTITGADHAGGIMVNSYARYLEISNNHIVGNQGIYGGGIRVGHPDLTLTTDNGLAYDHGRNDHIRIHHNHIQGNGGLGGSGGGVALYKGSDDYQVTDNWISGNYNTGNGGGIGHQGLSRNGLIARNQILFNHIFDQTLSVSGGGVYVGGSAPLNPGELTEGAGSVKIIANQIQGNLAGSGDGGGLRTELVNGQDVALNPDTPSQWHKIEVYNNTIVNNMAGLAGGGISLQDTAMIQILHNTIARNDSTATAGEAFSPGNPNVSTAQPAGVVSRAHSPQLAAAFGDAGAVSSYKTFSNPTLYSNIIYQNRSFYFSVVDHAMMKYTLLPDPAHPNYWDLAVLGTASPAKLNPMYCLLTNRSGYHGSNKAGDPKFVSAYYNGQRKQTVAMNEFTTLIDVAPAFDEGGNFIDVRFGPLTITSPITGKLFGDYHVTSTSLALNNGSNSMAGLSPDLLKDRDGETRPSGNVEIGADEFYASHAGNATPLALNESFTGKRNVMMIIDAPGILANDVDADGDLLEALLVAPPRRGVLTLNSDGSFNYMPNNNWTGTDTFTYRAYDGMTTSNLATVSIRVSASGSILPEGRNDSYTVQGGSVLTVAPAGVLGNDRDRNGDTIRAILGEAPQNGQLTLDPTGGFVYTPNPGFIGADAFYYRPYDGELGNRTMVAIDVTTPPQELKLPPAPRGGAILTSKNMVGHVKVTPNDPNLNDTFTFSISQEPTHGQASVTSTGVVAYTPAQDYVGEDALSVLVTDQTGLSGAATVTVTVSEDMHQDHGHAMLQGPPDTDGVDTDGDGIVDNDHVMLHLGAGDGFVKMADGRPMYMFGFCDLNKTPAHMAMHDGMLAGEFPAPTIAVREGQKLYLNLTNVGMTMRPDLFDAHTIHWHGFPNAAPVFDGMPDAGPAIKMGGTFTYFYNVVEPGTYMYHCHVEAVEHMQMGMLGNLFVTPKQDGNTFEYPHGSGRTYTKFVYNDGDGSTGYDVMVPIQLGAFDSNFHDAHIGVQPLPFRLMKDDYAMINGRGYPDTVNPDPLAPPMENGGKESQKMSSVITAKQGQRILLRLSNLCITRFFTVATSGLTLEIVGQNARLLRGAKGENLYYKTNSVTLGGGESMDAIIDTRDVQPGTYVLYTTNLNYLTNKDEDFGGMMTEIRIEK